MDLLPIQSNVINTLKTAGAIDMLWQNTLRPLAPCHAPTRFHEPNGDSGRASAARGDQRQCLLRNGPMKGTCPLPQDFGQFRSRIVVKPKHELQSVAEWLHELMLMVTG